MLFNISIINNTAKLCPTQKTKTFLRKANGEGWARFKEEHVLI